MEIPILLNYSMSKRYSIATYLVCIFISLSVFGAFSSFVPNSYDHYAHIRNAVRMAEGDFIPKRMAHHPLYHLMLNLLTGSSNQIRTVRIAAVFLLTVAVLLKIILSSRILNYLLQRQNITVSSKKKMLFLLTLVFISPIINWWNFPSIYLGQFTPNVWHNPTMIVLMPFSLAIVYFFEKSQAGKTYNSIYGGILLACSVLLKPSFAMVFIPALFLLTLFKKFSLTNLMIYTVPAIIIIAWQFYQIYQPNLGESRIIISPMAVWSAWSKNPVGSIVVSFAFPVAATFFFRNQFKNTRLVILSWMMVLIAFVQFVFLAEKGAYLLAGNFYWGIVPSVYILFLILMVEIISVTVEKARCKNKLVICYFLLALHFLSGIFFYIRSVAGYSIRA